MWYYVALILWILLLLDSAGAIVGHFSGHVQSWYAAKFPAIEGVFPLQNGWPYVYFALAVLGLLSTMVCKKNDGDKEDKEES